MGVFFLGPGDANLYGILVFVSGIGIGATLSLPSAIQADVIDYDELLTGQRREGQYVGLWSIAKKIWSSPAATTSRQRSGALPQQSPGRGKLSGRRPAP